MSRGGYYHPDVDEPVWHTSHVADLIGVTERRLAYAVDNHLLTVTVESPGSGYPRLWTISDAIRATRFFERQRIAEELLGVPVFQTNLARARRKEQT